MLEAIISFLPSEGAGAIGALDWSKAEREALAVQVIQHSTYPAHYITRLYDVCVYNSHGRITVRYVVKLASC